MIGGENMTRNERIIKLRKDRNLTQQEVADQVGLTQSMISHIEAGRKDPGKINKIILAKFFNVSVEWLFYEQVNDLESYLTPPKNKAS